MIFITGFVLTCLLMLPGTPLMLGESFNVTNLMATQSHMAGAGFALGVPWGQLAVSLGATLGAQAAYLVSGTLLRAFVEEDVLPNFPAFAEIDEVIGHKDESFKVCLLVRMCPILPYNVLNYALGVTSIKPWPHFIATFIGLAGMHHHSCHHLTVTRTQACFRRNYSLCILDPRCAMFRLQ